MEEGSDFHHAVTQSVNDTVCTVYSVQYNFTEVPTVAFEFFFFFWSCQSNISCTFDATLMNYICTYSTKFITMGENDL